MERKKQKNKAFEIKNEHQIYHKTFQQEKKRFCDVYLCVEMRRK